MGLVEPIETEVDLYMSHDSDQSGRAYLSAKKERAQYRQYPPRFRYRVGPIRIAKLVYQGYGLGHLEGKIDIQHNIPSREQLDQEEAGKKRRKRGWFRIEPPDPKALHPSPITGQELKGKTFFITHAAPGDLVEAEIVLEKRDVVYGSVTRIWEKSYKRVDPPCPVFGQCGGCQMQHISYSDELAYKQSAVVEQLEPLRREFALGQDIVQPIMASPRRFYYRNHIQIKSNRDKEIGFFERGRKAVVPLPEQGCMLLPEEMNSRLRSLSYEDIIPDNNMRVRQNNEGNVYIKKLATQPSPQYFHDMVHGIRFLIKMDNFFQTNRFQLENWISLILKLADLQGDETVLDLYCGGGLITLPLALRAQKAIGVELNPKSVQDARTSAQNSGIKNVEFVAGDAYEGSAGIDRVDVLVVDPPRAGLNPELVDWINGPARRKRLRKMIYVSCNPSTFVRDARLLLQANARLQQVHPVDMFPMTYHVELVSLFQFAK